MSPWITTVQQVYVRSQTETLNDIKTVTKDGITIHFDGIQVLSSVNKNQVNSLVKSFGMEFKRALVYDRIREELRLFCANHTIDEVSDNLLKSKLTIFFSTPKLNIFRSTMNYFWILLLMLSKMLKKVSKDLAKMESIFTIWWFQNLRFLKILPRITKL